MDRSIGQIYGTSQNVTKDALGFVEPGQFNEQIDERAGKIYMKVVVVHFLLVIVHAFLSVRRCAGVSICLKT